MKILSLQASNQFFEWNFNEITFDSNLTLLVGVSGVGKTQILKSIDTLQDIASGKSSNGFEWKIKFTSVENTKEFVWEGRFSTVDSLKNISTSDIKVIPINDDNDDDNDDDSDNSVASHPLIIFEKLSCGDEIIFRRDDKAIYFHEKKMPKLSSKKSLIYTLKEEDFIKNISDEFKKISLNDHAQTQRGFQVTTRSWRKTIDNYKTLDEVKNSNESIQIKFFACLDKQFSDVISKIKQRFVDIFPQVEDITAKQPEKPDFPFPATFNIAPIFYIKERDVLKWIPETKMSSGMLRTISHICELFLAKDGSIILMDEFENSLGINCIDVLTEDIIHENKTLQFIITSHHPYIINNIPYDYWKIVTRHGGQIKVSNAYDCQIGKSKQQAFTQLTKILQNQ